MNRHARRRNDGGGEKLLDRLADRAILGRKSLSNGGAIAGFGRPEIINTDQRSQFTFFALTNTLKDADIRISMDGRGRWIDNVFIERLWRPLKYERVYLNAFETGSEAKTGIG